MLKRNLMYLVILFVLVPPAMYVSIGFMTERYESNREESLQQLTVLVSEYPAEPVNRSTGEIVDAVFHLDQDDWIRTSLNAVSGKVYEVCTLEPEKGDIFVTYNDQPLVLGSHSQLCARYRNYTGPFFISRGRYVEPRETLLTSGPYGGCWFDHIEEFVVRYIPYDWSGPIITERHARDFRPGQTREIPAREGYWMELLFTCGQRDPYLVVNYIDALGQSQTIVNAGSYDIRTVFLDPQPRTSVGIYYPQ